MNLSKKKHKALYKLISLDYLISIVAWTIFWFYRQDWLQEIHPDIYDQRTWVFRDYALAFFFIPVFWLLIYYLSGTYYDLYRKSRLLELSRTFVSTIIGTLIIGFIAFANDVDRFTYFFEITALYFVSHLLFATISRLLYYKIIKQQLLTNKVYFPTIIIGDNGKIASVYKEIKDNPKVIGNKIVGYVSVNECYNSNFEALSYLGNINDVQSIILKNDIAEVIIAVNSDQHKQIEDIMLKLSYADVVIKVIPDLYDIISGTVKIQNFFQPVLITINQGLLPDWQRAIKRATDIFASVCTIVVLSPLYLFAIIKTKLSSPGPIFYKQERIGYNGVPFNIIKFRSMYVDAEKDGPKLSSDKDNRITPWGRVMRKWRIDEIPQFFNILKGDMSLVGPRPERQYFIDKISETHPHYRLLQRVKPGLSSWGMVEYGYAENVEQMIERMKYDLLYIQNCSLFLDWKIKLYTLKVVFQGRGK
jgi:exopolysaccharide biosynthesis polyprenyl glycosylphosphotransferase